MILQPVYGSNDPLSRLGNNRYRRQIGISIDRQNDRFQISSIFFPHAKRDLAVIGSSHRIFKPGISGIYLLRIVVFSRRRTKHLHGIFLHSTLIGTHKSQCPAIGRPRHQPGLSKFLFIYPVGNPIEYLVFLSVPGNLRFCTVEQILHIYIVFIHKRHPRTIGRQCGNLLFGESIRKGLQLIASYRSKIVSRPKRTTVYHLYIGIYQHTIFFTAERISRYCFYRSPGNFSYIQ